jgi:cytochrome c biogenesis protein CcmG/thiol:disulfide interchange protein DsbE
VVSDSEPAEPGSSSLIGWMLGAVVLAAALALILLGDSKVPAPLRRGSVAPDFTLPALSDESISLESLRGRVVLVNFWATWCKPCEDEMPSMEALYRRLHPRGFEMVAVSVDETTAPIDEFVQRMSITFPIALDPTQETARLYQTTGFPESLLVDQQGIVVERYVGPRDWEIYRERIERLMAAR